VIAYADASTVIAALLREPRAIRGWDAWTRLYASEVLSVEVRRTLDRIRLQGGFSARELVAAQQEVMVRERALTFVGVTRRLLRRASDPMAAPVRTLDAIHLATALAVRSWDPEPLQFLTHDRQQAVAARALGFVVVGDG
jgi:predicted nucleic acid-binding protein